MCCRTISSLIYRLKLDALKTKFVKTVRCVCGDKISTTHILLDCQQIRSLLPKSFTEKPPVKETLSAAFSNVDLIKDIAEKLLNSPVSAYL